jgi:hypothetical protein
MESVPWTVPFFPCIQQKPRSLGYTVEGPFWCHFKFPWTFRWNQRIWEDIQRVQASISSLLNHLLTSLVLWGVDMEKNPTTTLWRANSLQIDKNECGPWPWEYHPQSITPKTFIRSDATRAIPSPLVLCDVFWSTAYSTVSCYPYSSWNSLKAFVW